jgi:hypothetical protein
VLRLNFRSVRGDPPTLMLAACVRFCADGTMRGPDNYVVARAIEGGWQVSGRLHRELECEGPLRLRLVMDQRDAPKLLGPFQQVRTMGGILYGDDACLNVRVPGIPSNGAGHCHQLTIFSEASPNAKT